MPLYWTLKDFPELSTLSASERGQRWRKVYWLTLRHWQTWFGVVVLLVCYGLGVYIGRVLGHDIIGGVIGAGVGGFAFSQATIYVARRFYRSELLGVT